jgi:uncharacterized phage infection (PIP) family protein YhgE
MSMEEIYGLNVAINEIKKTIEEITGKKYNGNELRDSNTEEIHKLKKILYEVLNESIKLKERTNQMQINLDALSEEVARAQTVQSSAVIMLNKLTSQLQEISAELATKVNDAVVDTAPLNNLIEQLKASTSTLASAVADSSNAVTTKEVVLNANDQTKPTVQVIMPEVLPENVTVTAEQVVDKVDPTSTEPQVILTVEPAPVPVVEPAAVIETPAEQVNVNVDVPVEAAAVADNAGVNAVEAVQEAVATAEVPAEPVAETPAP